MNKPTFDALLCDLGNVIAFYDHMITAQNLAREMGLSAQEVHDTVFNSEITEAFVLGHIDEHEFYSRVKLLFPDNDFPEYEMFVNMWVMIFRPNHHMIEALDDLRGVVPMVLVSNTNRLHFEWIRTKFPEIISPFGENLVLSYEVHAQKPDMKMYEIAVEKAGVEANRCLFVDDVEAYTDAATQLGIKSLHYTDHRRFLHAAFPGEYLP